MEKVMNAKDLAFVSVADSLHDMLLPEFAEKITPKVMLQVLSGQYGDDFVLSEHNAKSLQVLAGEGLTTQALAREGTSFNAVAVELPAFKEELKNLWKYIDSLSVEQQGALTNSVLEWFEGKGQKPTFNT